MRNCAKDSSYELRKEPILQPLTGIIFLREISFWGVMKSHKLLPTSLLAVTVFPGHHQRPLAGCPFHGLPCENDQIGLISNHRPKTNPDPEVLGQNCFLHCIAAMNFFPKFAIRKRTVPAKGQIEDSRRCTEVWFYKYIRNVSERKRAFMRPNTRVRIARRSSLDPYLAQASLSPRQCSERNTSTTQALQDFGIKPP